MKTFLRKTLTGTPLEGFAKNKIYDWETVQVMKKVLKRDSNCVDVGCHKGAMLKDMLKFCPSGQHFGFEPIPDMYDELVKVFSGYKNAHVFNIALSDSPGTSSFVHVTSNPAYSGLKKRRYDKPNETTETIEVRKDKLDNVIPAELRIDFIKIDVEGAEYLVLKGAMDIIRRHKPVIVFEHGLGAADYYETRPADLHDLLTREGGLKISLMDDFLKGGSSLGKEEFIEQFNKALNYYFVAHP